MVYKSHVKTELVYLNQDGAISALNSKPLKLIDHFIFGSNISSTESNVNKSIGKAWTSSNWLLTILKSDKTKPGILPGLSSVSTIV